ncbi:MAG: hypothetical protein HON48_20470, partial [Desulfobacula sp.]|nr:hypothetical protein [Desulfobacula sp.]
MTYPKGGRGIFLKWGGVCGIRRGKLATKKTRYIIADKQNTLKALSDMTEKCEVIPVRIASLNSGNYFMLKESADRLLELNKLKNRLRFLSPFDNLVIQKDRIERLFD